MKKYLVRSEMNSDYYDRTREYIKDILLSLSGTTAFLVATGKLNFNAPPDWFIGSMALFLILWFMFFDLKKHRTIIFKKPSKSKRKNRISKWLDIPIKLSIGFTCASFYEWVQDQSGKDIKQLLLLLVSISVFTVLLGLFGYYTINLTDTEEG